MDTKLYVLFGLVAFFLIATVVWTYVVYYKKSVKAKSIQIEDNDVYTEEERQNVSSNEK